MTRTTGILGVVLVFVLGGACGSVITHHLGSMYMERIIKQGPPAIAQMVDQRIAQKLDLTEQQRAAFMAIAAKRREMMRELMAGQQDRIAYIFSSTAGEMKAVLTPEQREVFEEMEQRREEMMERVFRGESGVE